MLENLMKGGALSNDSKFMMYKATERLEKKAGFLLGKDICENIYAGRRFLRAIKKMDA